MDKTDSKLISEMAKLNENDSEQHRSGQNSQFNIKSESIDCLDGISGSVGTKKAGFSIECKNKILEVFKIFDTDNSDSIDMKEALKHWTGAFGKLSAKEFFSAVDENNDGEISLAEFIQFWKEVHQAGHKEEEIMLELENLKNGEAWVGFDNVRQNPASARS